MNTDIISAVRGYQKQLNLVVSSRRELEKQDVMKIYDGLKAQIDRLTADDQLPAPTAITGVHADAKDIARMLIRLNEYRLLIQKKPLKEWKGSTDELSQAIRDAKRIHGESVKSTPTPKTTVKPKKVVVVVPEPMTSEKKSLAAIVAKELGIHPKIARAKLRAKFGGKWKELPIKEIRIALKS